MLQKNKDSICSTLKAGLLTTPPFETQEDKKVKKESKAEDPAPEIDIINVEKAPEEKMEEEEESQSKRTNSSSSKEEAGSPVTNEGVESRDSNEEVESHEAELNNSEIAQSNGKEVLSEREEKMEEEEEEVEPLVSPTTFYPLESVRSAERVMKYLQDMETRLFDAHLQMKVNE